jgi:hypothetical protein
MENNKFFIFIHAILITIVIFYTQNESLNNSFNKDLNFILNHRIIAEIPKEDLIITKLKNEGNFTPQFQTFYTKYKSLNNHKYNENKMTSELQILISKYPKESAIFFNYLINS